MSVPHISLAMLPHRKRVGLIQQNAAFTNAAVYFGQAQIQYNQTLDL